MKTGNKDYKGRAEAIVFLVTHLLSESGIEQPLCCPILTEPRSNITAIFHWGIASMEHGDESLCPSQGEGWE